MYEFLKKIIIWNRFISYEVVKTEEFVQKVSRQVEKGSKILDVGAGLCPYKKYFQEANYISQDFCLNGDNMNWDFSHIDIKSDLHNIPVENESFDYILCMSVLEHIRYPQRAFKEFSRILKNKGRLFITVPLTAGEHHEPFDFFRFSKYALQMLAEENGFRVVKINRQGGFFIFLAQTFTGLSHYYAKNKYLEKFLYTLFYPINFMIAFICYFLDKVDRTTIATNYECVFEKI
jgi:SAM-dependent methyltransferase